MPESKPGQRRHGDDPTDIRSFSPFLQASMLSIVVDFLQSFYRLQFEQLTDAKESHELEALSPGSLTRIRILPTVPLFQND
jgi:hypothetical protein